MRSGVQIVFAIGLLLAAVGPVDAQRAPTSSDRARIEALIEQTETANNEGDVETWVGLFATDAVYMPPNVPAVTTREGLIEIAEAGFRHESSIDIQPLEIRVVGDWAFARTQVSGCVTVAGSGEVISVDTKQIVIYNRDPDGSWRIARLISNSNTQ